MANNAIPDSIIMNMTCRSLSPPVEPKVRSIEVLGVARVTLWILNTIMPVIRVFTAMDAANAVMNRMFVQLMTALSSLVYPGIDTSQVARGDKLKWAYQMKID